MYAGLLELGLKKNSSKLDALTIYELPGYKLGDEETFTSIKESEIKNELTEFFLACKMLNDNIEIAGLPHGRGYLHERPTILEIRKIFVSEKNRYEIWKLEQARG